MLRVIGNILFHQVLYFPRDYLYVVIATTTHAFARRTLILPLPVSLFCGKIRGNNFRSGLACNPTLSNNDCPESINGLDLTVYYRACIRDKKKLKNISHKYKQKATKIRWERINTKRKDPWRCSFPARVCLVSKPKTTVRNTRIALEYRLRS